MSDEPIFLGTDKEMPSRADARQNRADILVAARRLFEAYGVDQVSMSQISREACVGKGTLYRHFRNKADLCHALLDDAQQVFQNNTLAHLRNAEEPPDASLLWFLEELCNFTYRNIDLLFETTQTPDHEDALSLDHPAHHWQWLTILGLLRQAQLQGDLEYIADALYTLVDARLYHFQHCVRGYSHQRIVDGILAIARCLIFS